MVADEPGPVLLHLCRGSVALRKLTHTNLVQIRAMDLPQHDVVAESSALGRERARARPDEQQQRGNGVQPHVVSYLKYGGHTQRPGDRFWG